MIIEHIKASDLETIQWSGGTTTQLAIYPKEATYQDRNFLFRISTATVESEESTFTKLPEVSRKIMILDGKIKIEHQNHYSKILKKFEQDSFEGNWDTKSYGKAIDFNLMTKGNTNGTIEAISLANSKDFMLNINHDFYGIYIYSGEIRLLCENKGIVAHKGDVILIQPENKYEKIELSSQQNSEIVITKVNLD